MKYSNYIFFLTYIILLIPQLCIMKLYDENYYSNEIDNDYSNSYFDEKKYSYNKYVKNNNKFSQNNNPDDEDFKKPNSKLDFFISYIKNRIISYLGSFEEYYDGLKYIFSKYKILFRRFSKTKIINKTLSNKIDRQYSKKDDLLNHKKQRQLEQTFIETKAFIGKKLEENLNQSFPYNNSDLYEKMACPLIPDLKVYFYNYFCNKEKVSKEEYRKRASQGEFCEFYNNTQKICFCPINYQNCQYKTFSKMKCMTRKLIVNNEYDLTQYYDTFNDEHTKIPILDNNKKNFDFSLNIKCGMELDDSISEKENFYLINPIGLNDQFLEFDMISTEYHNRTENGTQYTKEEVLNKTTNILKYFIRKKNLVVFKNTSLYLSFNLIDQMWAIPYRIKWFEIKEDIVESFLSGDINFNFTVDLKDLIDNGEGEGPFEKRKNNFKYPFFDKGDLHFFEIELKDVGYDQIRFVPFRGEIKK